MTLAFGISVSSFALKTSRCASDSGVHDRFGPLRSFTSRREGQPQIRKSSVAVICSLFSERSRISSDSCSPTNVGTAARPQYERLRSRRRLHLPELCKERLVLGRVP